MDQQLGLALEKKFRDVTYLSLLPREIKELLYSYVFRSPLKFYITTDDLIHPAHRIFEREVILTIVNNGMAIRYNFDINSIGRRDLTKFINMALGKIPNTVSLQINKYMELVLKGDMTTVDVNVVVEDSIEL